MTPLFPNDIGFQPIQKSLFRDPAHPAHELFPDHSLLGSVRPPQQPFDHGIYRFAAVQHGVNSLADGHLDTEALSQPRYRRGGSDPFHDRAATAQHHVKKLSLTERQTERKIAGLNCIAGQHEVAEP
jgi:hypothetical protein